MKQTAQSTNANQQSELRFILVNGLLKKGTFFAGLYFLCDYLLRFHFLLNFEFEDFFGVACDSIINGAILGLAFGLIDWHRLQKKLQIVFYNFK
jgi:hypothetical protein